MEQTLKEKIIDAMYKSGADEILKLILTEKIELLTNLLDEHEINFDDDRGGAYIVYSSSIKEMVESLTNQLTQLK